MKTETRAEVSRITITNQEGDRLHVANDLNDCDVITLNIDGSEFWINRSECAVLIDAIEKIAK